MLQAIIDSGGDMVHQLRALPWGAHALMALALISGIVLWCAGRRVLKPMVVVAFALMGGVAGLFLPPITALGDSLSIYAGLAAGLVVGALMGVVLYRFAMATSFGVVLAVAVPLSAAIALRVPESDAAPPQEGPPPIAAQQDEDLARRIEVFRQSVTPDRAEGDQRPAPEATDRQRVAAAVNSATQHVRTFLQALDQQLKARWDLLPTSHRLILGGSTAVGLALGVVLGLLLPRWAAGAVTAMFGAAVWLPCSVWFWTALGLPGAGSLDHRPDLCLLVWAAASLTGMFIQWYGLVRGKQKKHKKPEPASE